MFKKHKFPWKKKEIITKTWTLYETIIQFKKKETVNIMNF